MPPPAQLVKLLEIIGASPNEIDQMMIQRLRSRGFIVGKSGPTETAKHICARLGISTSKFRRRRKRRPPNPSDVDLGPTGRLIGIRSNLEYDKFLVGARSTAEITVRIAKPANKMNRK
jgi:hypothetical protein